MSEVKARQLELLGPCLELLSCDYCFETEAEDAWGKGLLAPLRPMYRDEEGLVICELCVMDPSRWEDQEVSLP